MKKLYYGLSSETFVSDKNQFSANVSCGVSQTPAYPRLSFRLWWSVLFLLLGGAFNSYAQCTLTFNKISPSGCYSVSGVSKATVSVEVAWTNAPTNGYIVVTSGTQSQTILPGTITVTYAQPPGYTNTVTGTQTIVSPQVVAFEVDANGSSGTVTARFSNQTSCSATGSFTTPAACLPTTCSGNNLGGMVFKDFNDDGTMQAGETAGIPAVTVTAIACDGTPYTATTDNYGLYSINIPANKYPVRVEFSNVPSVYNLGVNGNDSRTSVQFINAPSCDVNLGINNPVDYCSNNPVVFVPCYVNGDPLAGGTAGSAGALVSIPYGVSSATTFTGEVEIATASQIGAIWGLAYNKYTKRLFQAAFLKRHAGLGPQGLGGIYVTNYSNPAVPTTTSFLNVTALNISVGNIASNSARGLLASATSANRDIQSFSAVGKVGMGDLEISDDGNMLWFTNLFDKKLYSIDITQYNITGTLPTAANVTSYSIPASCSGGQYRPWAIKVYNGKVYVGGVCDAQSSGSKSNLRASVYELSGTTFTQIFDFPLTYPKGYPAAANVNRTGWFPWTDNFNDLLSNSTETYYRYPVPIFTDIEFDVDGSMVLGFGDRTGLQGGDQNYRPDNTNSDLYSVNSQAGDVLRAYYANGAFVLENNAKAGPNTGSGKSNSQGPGFGEFYNDNWIQDGTPPTPYYHAENVMGGLALKPGSGEVVVTTVDPVDRHPFAGGVRYLNNKTGQAGTSYAVYVTTGPDGDLSPGTFAKATGLGDIELSCNTIELLQIGNRVWLDDDKDGEQDACEKGLAGVSVSLYRSGTVVARTITDANGEYYFPNYANPSSVTFTGSQTALVPNTAYQLAFGTNSQYSSGTLTVANGKYLLTTANATGTNINDLNDSDAAVTTIGAAPITVPVISLTTDAVGTSDHTYDVGFFCQTITSGAISLTQATCNLTNNTANSNGRITVSGIVNGDKAAIVAFGGTVPSYTATTNVTITGGVASFSGLANPTATTGTSYSIIIYNGPCCTAVVTSLLPRTDCTCGLNATVTAGNCNPVNNQYSVSGTISLTNTPAGSFTVTDGTRSSVVSVTAGQPSVNFSVTGLTSNGITHTVSVVSSGTACGSTSLTYLAPASCTVAASIAVTSATVCYGNSATLTTSGCNGTVSWSNSTTGTSLITPNLTQTTNYTATCTTVTQTTFAVGTVTVYPQPVLTLNASSTFVTQATPVSLSAIGCVGNVTWNTAETTPVISVTPMNSTQTYSATCTTGPGCFTTASITVTTLPPASITASSATICYGSSATLVATGCASGTIAWSNGTTGSTLSIPSLTATTSYTATCSTPTGSTASAVGTVTVYPQPVLTINASSTFVTQATPVSLSAIGCVGNVLWNTAETTPVISVTPMNSTQTYSATCTTGPGCFTTAAISVSTLPPASITASSATICYGASATLVATGCASGTIAWSNGTTGSTLAIASLTATTSYTATCSTPTGSTASAVGTVTVYPQPVLAINASSTFVTQATPVSLSAIGCVGNVLWNTAETTPVISVTPMNSTQTYSATCTTGPGCFTTAAISVSTLPPASITASSATICYGASATLVATGCASGTIAWSNGTTGSTLSIPSLTATTSYTATCSTPTGSTASAVGTVTVYPQPVLAINASSTFVTQATPVSLSAIGCVGDVLWNTAETTPVISVTPMNSTQTYSATCTTGPGCFTTASITVTTLPPASITASSATICYGSSATLVATGCASGTIAWSNGTTGSTLSIPSLTATTSYTATCSTPTGSTASAVGTVTVYPQPVLAINASSTFVTQATPVSLSAIGCVGDVLWNTAETTPVISVTPMNSTQTYSATCTTGPGCFTTASITVTTLPPASITASSATICYGSSATLVATGCASGTIAWSNGTTGSTLSIPSLTATTSNTATCSTPTGSTASAVGTVTVYPQPVLTLNASSTFVTQATPVSLSAIGCVGNVTWSTAETTPVISVTPMNSTQTYSATCTTGPGCFTTASITVTTLPPASITASSATICYGASATLVATGCASGTIAWSNGTTGSTLAIASLTATTSYTATCSTPTGSTASAVGTVTVYPQPVLAINASSTFVTQATPVSLSAIGCVGDVLWNTAETTPVISVTPMNSTQTYSATCTTGINCFTTASITVTTLPPASITASSATICYGSSATLVATGCASGTIAWSNGTTGSTLAIASLTATTSYTATCSTPTGSTASAVGTVTVYPQPVLAINASSTFVTQATPVSLSAIGCVGNVLWNTAETTPVISVTPMNSTQTYSATCTTGPGCFTTASITVTTLPPASITASSATICYGSSATLVATGCASGTIAWSNGTTGSTLAIASLTATTSYTATCSTPTGSTASAVGTVTVYPQPVLAINASSTFVTQATPVSLSAIGCVGNVTWNTAETTPVISVTPMNSTQTYSATCTTGPGCFTTASITVTTLPPASLTAASTTVCLGSSATLVAVGCTSGSVVWSNGTTGSTLTITSLTTTTSYTATCTTPTGSVSSVVATAFVETPASLTISRTAITDGQSVTISVRGCNGNTMWSTGQMNSSFIVVPSDLNATYSVTCTSPLGCSSTAKLTIGNLNPNDFTVGDAITCQSQSATLTAVGCQGTLFWTGAGTNGQTTASIVVTPAQTTAYTVACTNGADVTELVAQVTVVPAPSLTLTVSSLTITEGDPLSITALGCDIGQLIWSLTGVTGNVLSTTANLTTSTYSVTCALTPTCLDTKSVTVTVIPLLPQLNLTKVASKTRANLGEVISYTVTLSNTGNAPATNVVVEDVLSAGLAYVPNSASVSLGTIAAGSPISSWSITSLAAGQTATLVLSASILAEGVHYNTARIPGDTTTTCVSVAYRVCQGSGYAIRILGPTGYTRYQWYNGTQLVAETTTNSYTATAAGEYKVVVDNGSGTCPDGSCCPVIIEEVAIPSTFTVAGTNPSCVALTPQNNGVLTVSGLGTDLTGYRYAISEGSSFTATNPTTQPVPANGVIATTLTAPKTYTVRVYDQLGCYADRTVTLSADCVCPPATCVPITVKKIVRP